MKIMLLNIRNIVLEHGSDIVFSSGMEYQKTQYQHGNTTCFEHSVSVACVSVYLAAIMQINVDIRSLVRGALLHDYFLYDWRDKEHSLHGFSHAQIALTNASRDFTINDIERNIIERHMFPLNIAPPKYRESFIVCLADKLCAGYEIIRN